MGFGGGRVGVVAAALAMVMGCTGPGGAESLFSQTQYRGDSRGDYRGDSYRDDSYGRRGNDYGNQRRGGGSVPRGSYLQSCGNASVQGSTLSATCRGDRGRSFETSIDLTRCGSSDIGNGGGTLQCSGARGRSRRAD